MAITLNWLTSVLFLLIISFTSSSLIFFFLRPDIPTLPNFVFMAAMAAFEVSFGRSDFNFVRRDFLQESCKSSEIITAKLLQSW